MNGTKRSLEVLSAMIFTIAASNHPLQPLIAQTAYVTDAQLDVVSVLDTATKTIAARIPVGPGIRPCGIALSPDGNSAYVANPDSGSVSVIDLVTLTTNAIYLGCPSNGCYPKGVIVSPDGGFLYTISEDWDRVAVTEIDADARVVTRTFGVATNGVSSGCGVGTITPDGRLLYVRVPGIPLALAVIDTTTGVELTPPMGGPFHSVAALPDGTAVLAPGPGRIAIISTTTQQIERTIPIDGDGGPIVPSPDGTTAYVLADRNVVAVDLVAGNAGTTIPLGQSFVSDLAMTHDGDHLFVADLSTQSILEIDTATNAITRAIALEHGPESLAVTPDGTTLYATNGNFDLRAGSLSRVDLETGRSVRLFGSAGPSAVAATPDGGELYVTNSLSEEVVIVDTRLDQAVASIPVASPIDVVADTRHERVFVGSQGEDSAGVFVIDRRERAVVATIALAEPVTALALSADGDRLYAATWNDPFTSDVTSIDTRTLMPMATIRVDQSLTALAVSPDGRAVYGAGYMFFLNEVTGGVAVIDPAANRVAEVLATGGVTDVVVSPDGRTVYAPTDFYFTFEQRPPKLSIVDAVARTIRAAIPIDGVGAIAIEPAGRALYLAFRQRPGKIAVIDTSTLETSATVEVGVGLTDIVVVGEWTEPACAGDCNSDETVTVVELIRGVGVLLGSVSVESCRSIDGDLDGRVTVADLVRAVRESLGRCAPSTRRAAPIAEPRVLPEQDWTWSSRSSP